MEQRKDENLVLFEDYINKKNKIDEYANIELESKEQIELLTQRFNDFLKSDILPSVINYSKESAIGKESSIKDKEEGDNLKNNSCENCKEVELEMKKIIMINKINFQFLIVSFLTTIFSLVGLFIFSVTGYYVIDPIFYLILFLMGIGWGATALTSIIKNRR